MTHSCRKTTHDKCYYNYSTERNSEITLYATDQNIFVMSSVYVDWFQLFAIAITSTTVCSVICSLPK